MDGMIRNLQSSFADGTAAFRVAGWTYGVCGRCQVWLLVVASGVDCCLEGAFDVCLGQSEVDCEEEGGDEGLY